MTASFVRSLCGYRLDRDGLLTGYPNTSDAGDSHSVELGRELFGVLGVGEGTPAPQGEIDEVMCRALIGDLQESIDDQPLVIERDRPLYAFEQYGHLEAIAQLLAHSP